MQKTSKRLLKDFQALQEEGPSNGIYIKQAVPGDFSDLRMVLIGPEGPYHNCLFFFKITFPNKYPFKPPYVVHQCLYSIRAHPNLYLGPEAKVCLSILGTWAGPPWSPMMTFNTIAQTILSILDNEPLRNEPGYVKSSLQTIQPYTDYVRYICLRESIERAYTPAISGKLNKPYAIFQNEIATYAKKHMSEFSDMLMDYAAEFDGKQLPRKKFYSNCTGNGEKYNYADLFSKLGIV